MVSRLRLSAIAKRATKRRNAFRCSFSGRQRICENERSGMSALLSSAHGVNVGFRHAKRIAGSTSAGKGCDCMQQMCRARKASARSSGERFVNHETPSSIDMMPWATSFIMSSYSFITYTHRRDIETLKAVLKHSNNGFYCEVCFREDLSLLNPSYGSPLQRTRYVLYPQYDDRVKISKGYLFRVKQRPLISTV